MAKVARVQISKEYLEIFLRGDFGIRPNTVITSTAPKDLKIVGLAYPDFYIGYPYTLDVYVESETFAELPEGSQPPLLPPFTYTITEQNG